MSCAAAPATGDSAASNPMQINIAQTRELHTRPTFPRLTRPVDPTAILHSQVVSCSLLDSPLCYRKSQISLQTPSLDAVRHARYTEALRVYGKVRELIAAYPDGTFPRVDYPLSNELAVRFRSGVVAATEALARQRQIVKNHGVEGDPFYLWTLRGMVLRLCSMTESCCADVEVGAFGQPASQQPVGLLVGGPLPRRVRVTEVDLDAEVSVRVRLLARDAGGQSLGPGPRSGS